MNPGDHAIPAVIMAGGKDSPEFLAAGENPQRGLVEIHGLPMISYVVRALRATPAISEIVLVCRPGYPDVPGVDRTLEATGSMVENLGLGLHSCPGAEAVMFATADIPFLTGSAVEDYARRCLESGASLCWAAIPRTASERRFPGMNRTYARLADGEFTGGNLALVRPDLWPGINRVLEIAYQARKKPWLLARLLGPRTLWRLLVRTLSIAEAEARISKALGGPARGIVTEYAELGADVDHPEDLRLARQLLAPVDRET